MQRQRPRELPVDRPSAAQSYVPQALVRGDDRQATGTRDRRWLPSGSAAGSKHRLASRAKHVADHSTRVDVVEFRSEAQETQLEALEDEVAVLEAEVDTFVQEFYVAAAAFSAQAAAQKALARALVDE